MMKWKTKQRLSLAFLMLIMALQIWAWFLYPFLDWIAEQRNGGINPSVVREMVHCNEGKNMIEDPSCTGANVKP